MEFLYLMILLPLIVGLIIFIIPDRFNTFKGLITILVVLVCGAIGIYVLHTENQIVNWTFLEKSSPIVQEYAQLNLTGVGKVIILFIIFFSLFIAFYSIKYNKQPNQTSQLYSFYLITLSAALGVILTNHLIVFITCWGITGITLYKLIDANNEKSAAAAKKTLILVGASDSIMLLGIALIWLRTGNFLMSEIQISTDTITANMAFICLLIGCFTKAGAFPFHTWVPDYTSESSAVSSAYLPASLDKLLGIYFLYRICTTLFILNQWLILSILIIGAGTIIIAVMMALIQHDYRKLLGYHAVSQVGYMVVGIGLGSPLGLAGGLFHMINNALYKSGLFLSAGNIQKQTGKKNIEDVGGLAKTLPITFISAFIFALAISGVPPLNGFASKWCIYQAIVDFGKGTELVNKLWILWLGLAVLGSALTLASFIKFISGIFLGKIKSEFESIREVPFLMWFPLTVLAAVCVFFGVFMSGLVVPDILQPMVGPIEFPGLWDSVGVSLLVIVSIMLGFIIYWSGDLKKFRTEENYVGGEMMQESASFNVTEFYKTISNFEILAFFYKRAEKKWFDIYDQSRNLVLSISQVLSNIHNGILTNYAIWVVLGFIAMLLILML